MFSFPACLEHSQAPESAALLNGGPMLVLLGGDLRLVPLSGLT